MGSSISTINNNKDNKKRKNSLGLWSNEEKIKIENATKNFEKIAKYVSEYFYYGIPVKLTHQSIDPLSPLWVTPDTNKVMQRVQASEQDNLQKDWVYLCIHLFTCFILFYLGNDSICTNNCYDYT